jgi:mRNA-degrading endonuclease HigB of HigAB toxin-antitoxin module
LVCVLSPKRDCAFTGNYNVARKPRWSSHADVKADFGASVDLALGRYIFDIRGTKYRFVCLIDFVGHGILIRYSDVGRGARN